MKMRQSIVPPSAVYDRRIPFGSFGNSIRHVLFRLSQRYLLSITRTVRKYKGRLTTNYLKAGKDIEKVRVYC